MNSKQVGNLGERIAEKFLKERGYQILDRNYSFWLPGSPKKGEIDIIAKPRRNAFDILRGKKDDIIHFIEVKTLTESNRGPSSVGISPEEKVNFPKQKKLIKTAESWLLRKKIPLDSKWQIDVISVGVSLVSKKAKLRHLKNVSL